MGIYKIKPNFRKYSRVANNEFELCKFPCVHLTRFRLVLKQLASARTHTWALSWTCPFKFSSQKKMICSIQWPSLVYLMCYFWSPTRFYSWTCVVFYSYWWYRWCAKIWNLFFLPMIQISSFPLRILNWQLAPWFHSHRPSINLKKNKQLVYASACVCRDIEHAGSLELERGKRVALGCASSNSSLLSALQTSQVLSRDL